MSSSHPPRVTLFDLNGGPAAILQELQGVGAVLAARIVEHREHHGPFRSANDLAQVKGMGLRRAERLWASFDALPDFENASFHPIDDPRISAHELPFELMATVPASVPPFEDEEDEEAAKESWDDGWVERVVRDDEQPAPRASTGRLLPARVSTGGEGCASPRAPSRAPSLYDGRPTLEKPVSRRSFRTSLAVAAVAVAALALVVLPLFGRSIRQSSVEQSRVEVEDVRREVADLRKDIATVSSTQSTAASAAETEKSRLDALATRVEQGEREQAATDKAAAAQHERIKRVEDRQDKQGFRMVKLEDELAWQRMSQSAQVSALRAQVKQAADRIEAMSAGE